MWLRDDRRVDDKVSFSLMSICSKCIAHDLKPYTVVELLRHGNTAPSWCNCVRAFATYEVRTFYEINFIQ